MLRIIDNYSKFLLKAQTTLFRIGAKLRVRSEFLTFSPSLKRYGILYSSVLHLCGKRVPLTHLYLFRHSLLFASNIRPSFYFLKISFFTNSVNPHYPIKSPLPNRASIYSRIRFNVHSLKLVSDEWTLTRLRAIHHK